MEHNGKKRGRIGIGGLYAYFFLGALILIMIFASDAFLTPYNLYNLLSTAAIKGILACGMTSSSSPGIDISVGSIGIWRYSGRGTSGIDKCHGAVCPFGKCPRTTCHADRGSRGFADRVLQWLYGHQTADSSLHRDDGNDADHQGSVVYLFRRICRHLQKRYSEFPVDWKRQDRRCSFNSDLLHCYCRYFRVYPEIHQLWPFSLRNRQQRGSSRFSGVNVNKIKMLAYTTLGTLAGLGGIILTARLNSATPDAGMGYELDCITAVVIGGTSLSGGKGTIAGTVAGIFIMVVLATSLNLLGVQSIYQYLSKGLILLIAVLIDSYLNRRRG